MKIAVHLARHRRLVALGGLSLLLHALAFALLDALLAPPPARIGMPIALRLAPDSAPAAKTVVAETSPLEAAQPSAAASSPSQPRAELPAMRPLLPAAESAAGAPASSASATPGSAPLQMPGRYRVQLPPSSHLRYVVTRTAPGQPAAASGPAELVWERGAGAYRLRLDGVLGELASTGGEDDAGLAPDEATEAGPAGGARVTRFNRAEGRIEQGINASETLTQGSQDRASVLLQLAGIGIADPDQVQDTIDIVVAGSGGARIARWQVVGKEDLNTPAGAMEAVHLLQLAAAGEARVEVWLAPQRAWLPVQLRVTRPDGTVDNQVVSAIESATRQ